jgi:hypothetical protein
MNQIHKKLFRATAENDHTKVRCRFADNFWDFDSTELHLPLKIFLLLFLDPLQPFDGKLFLKKFKFKQL